MTRAVVVLALALAALAVPPAQAERALTPPAPELPADAAWINAMPFTLGQLRERRVVLLAFINSANINSLRALKALEAWDEAWSLKGLMIIGVHAPAFGYQKDAAAVQGILRHYGVKFPVVLDNDGRIAKAYANDGWPAFFLIDAEGSIIYDHVGEDRYGELESEIRQAVAHLPDYRSVEDPPLEKDAVLKDCGKATPEVAVSTSIRPAESDAPSSRLLVFSGREGRLESIGRWTLGADGAALAQGNKELEAGLRITYRGAQALAALTPGPGKKTARFFVKQDGLWLHSLDAGSDVQFDDDGRSYVTVGLPRLYELAANANDDAHQLEVIPAARGAAIHQFSFSDRCLPIRP